MGFDIHGMNPNQNVSDKDHERFPLLSVVRALDNWDDQWDMVDRLSDTDQKQYWAEYNEHEEANPGIYFRNNVWWWRPLWGFVAKHCNDILDDNDIERGHYNDGHEYSEEKAKKIAARLQKLVDDGTVKKEEDEITEANKKMGESEDRDTQFMSNYPFNESNVKQFIKFLNECGGFQIC